LPENEYKLRFLNGILRCALLKHDHELCSNLIIFSKKSRWVVGPTQLYIQWVTTSFRGSTAAGASG